MLVENVKGVNHEMFAIYAHIFIELYEALKEGEGHMDDVYDFLSSKYRGNSRKALDYFYVFLQKNKEYFIEDIEKNINEGYRRKILFNYWDKKGFDAKPIYHYVGLNPKNKEDRAEIFNYILDYYGGYEKLREKFLSEIPIGVPVHIDAGGYSIDYIVTGVDVDIIEPGSWDHNSYDGEIYYEMTGLINGDTSEVTLLTNGETYNIGDISTNKVDLDDSVVEKIGYEIFDTIRDYFDTFGEKYNVLGDLVDYKVVDEQEFNNNILK